MKKNVMLCPSPFSVASGKPVLGKEAYLKQIRMRKLSFDCGLN